MSNNYASARDLPPRERLSNSIDNLDRLHGFVGCLRDTLERVTAHHGVDYGSRLHVVDHIDYQIERIESDLVKVLEGMP